MRSIAVVLATVSFAVSGCGAVIFKTFSLESDPPTSVSLDAKQRMVFVAKRQNVTATVASSGGAGSGTPAASGDYRSDRIVCAEPSPDTMVGVAASLGLDLPLHTGSVGLDTSMAQAVAQIGTRSQTIQLLRDGLYRACEAYMNGTFSAADYELMLRHYDMTMVMLVAIDGLTRSCAKPGAISTSSNAQHSPQNPSPAATNGNGDGNGNGNDDANGNGQAADQQKVKDAAKGATKDTPAAGAAAPSGQTKASGGGPASNATANAASEEQGQCAVSDVVAQQVDRMVEAFFQYKMPLHQEYCMQTVLERLLQVSKLESRNVTVNKDLVDKVDMAVTIAQKICGAKVDAQPQAQVASPAPKPVTKKP